jgi:uncharacterized membrane protein
MVKELFTKEEKERIEQAIRVAETNTSGEIRVHIESGCTENVLDRAAYYFETLQMHKTDLRNGVLFYLAVKDQKFAILGDAGINARVPVGFWDTIKDEMAGLFKQGDFAKGLETGILKAGEQLKAHFPYQTNDTNELSDEISFGK